MFVTSANANKLRLAYTHRVQWAFEVKVSEVEANQSHGGLFTEGTAEFRASFAVCSILRKDSPSVLTCCKEF